MNNGCGKILGMSPATLPKCGGLWMGGIAYCEDCRKANLEEENLRLQNELLREKLRQQHDPQGDTK